MTTGAVSDRAVSEGAAAIDIVIRTYFRDFRRLRGALASVRRFVAGHRRIVVVMPLSSLVRLPADLAAGAADVTVMTCPDYRDDYLGQQVTKLHADQLSDAAALAHLDSDCVFEAPCALPRLLTDGPRPVIRYRRESPRTVADGWRACVTDFFGESLPFDALVTPPLLFPRWLYADLRAVSLARHRCTLESWALARRGDMLSEFSLLAAAAWFRHRDRFTWRAVEDEAAWPCRQDWSRAPAARRAGGSFAP